MFYFISLIVISFDQITKLFATSYLPIHAPINVFPGFNLFLTFNKGVSFSLFSNNSPYTPILLSCFSLIICAFVFYWLFREKNQLTRLGLSFILGGAIGNVIDRIRYGSVVDFLDVYFKTYHWPAFNVADSFICVGATLIFVVLFFMKGEKK